MQTSFRQRHQDEHMTHYEWCGAGTGMTHTPPPGTRRDHPWHASTGILALLTTLLILDGGGRTGPVAQASAPVSEGKQEP